MSLHQYLQDTAESLEDFSLQSCFFLGGGGGLYWPFSVKLVYISQAAQIRTQGWEQVFRSQPSDTPVLGAGRCASASRSSGPPVAAY